MKQNNIFKGITEIRTLTFVNYCFAFGELKPVEHNSILMKLENFHNNGFVPEDFVEYLMVRRIPFKLYFVPNFKRSFWENIDNLWRISKIKYSQRKPSLQIE